MTDDYSSEKKARDLRAAALAGLIVYCIAGLVFGFGLWTGAWNDCRNTDVCLKFLVFCLCILAGQFWPFLTAFAFLGNVFCGGADTCCGINWRNFKLGKRSPKKADNLSRRRLNDVEGQASRVDVVNEQPGWNEDIELPPYPGPPHIETHRK